MAARMHNAWVGEVGCMPGVQMTLAPRRNRMIRPPIFAEAGSNEKGGVSRPTRKGPPIAPCGGCDSTLDAAFAG